jgi:hypothetical protein
MSLNELLRVVGRLRSVRLQQHGTTSSSTSQQHKDTGAVFHALYKCASPHPVWGQHRHSRKAMQLEAPAIRIMFTSWCPMGATHDWHSSPDNSWTAAAPMRQAMPFCSGLSAACCSFSQHCASRGGVSPLNVVPVPSSTCLSRA